VHGYQTALARGYQTALARGYQMALARGCQRTRFDATVPFGMAIHPLPIRHNET